VQASAVSLSEKRGKHYQGRAQHLQWHVDCAANVLAGTRVAAGREIPPRTGADGHGRSIGSTVKELADVLGSKGDVTLVSSPPQKFC